MRAFAAAAIAAAALFAIAGCAATPPAPVPPAASSAEAATRGLETLRAMADQGKFAVLGFSSPEEAKTATLGVPLHIYMVRLDELQQYRPAVDPATLLHDAAQDFYPVLVAEQTRSSIIISGADGRFAAVSFGGAPLARALTERQQAVMSAPLPRNAAPAQNFAIVHVAALNLYFLAFEQRGRLMLAPASDVEQFALRADVPLPAAVVFARLAEQARTMRPDVPS
jgi:predicted small lipoprotein YifL